MSTQIHVKIKRLCKVIGNEYHLSNVKGVYATLNVKKPMLRMAKNIGPIYNYRMSDANTAKFTVSKSSPESLPFPKT